MEQGAEIKMKNLITKALEIHSDLDEGEIVEVEIVSKIIFDLVERLEAAERIVDVADTFINMQGPDINREIEKRKMLKETLKEYKELDDE